MQTSSTFLSNQGTAAPRKGRPLVQPTRNPVRHTGRYFRGKLFSLKNARLVRCESLLEMRAACFFEFASGVLSFSEQPPPLAIRIRRRKRKYTPDFIVHWREGRDWLVEVKPSELAGVPEMQEKFVAAREAAEEQCYRYVVLTERVTDKPGASFIEELLAIRRRVRTRGLGSSADAQDSRETTPRLPVALAHATAHGGSLSLTEVLRLLGNRAGAMNELKTLLAFRILAWNVDQQLTKTSRIYQPSEKDDEELFV